MAINPNFDAVGVAEEKELEKAPAAMRKSTIIVRRFLRNKVAVVGLAIFILLVIFSLTGQFFTKWTSEDLDFLAINQPPGKDHILGTGPSGQDLYIRLVDGLRISIVIGLVVGIATTLIAAVYGCTQAFYGGKLDKIMLLFLEMLIMVPSIIIIAIATSGNSTLSEIFPDWITLCIVLIIFGWMGTARLIRALSFSTMSRDFVRAAKYVGVPNRQIIWRHLLPNLGSLLILQFTLGVSIAILSETGLSFVGIGIKPPGVSLGVLLSQGNAQINTGPWMFWIPLAVMFLLTGSFALMNDGLRDALDPTSSSVGKARKKKRKKKEEEGQ
ncbi:ABC transporter permease [Haematomicrobium sanguinis]|uniref:ABC transporter permease n=1 Tax=Haematomicrobium sanguinis TaxID=479106 RepID=UPI000558BC49|nr:ABC transporter permease [Haematomicrobium sanguinis]